MGIGSGLRHEVDKSFQLMLMAHILSVHQACLGGSPCRQVHGDGVKRVRDNKLAAATSALSPSHSQYKLEINTLNQDLKVSCGVQHTSTSLCCVTVCCLVREFLAV